MRAGPAFEQCAEICIQPCMINTKGTSTSPRFQVNALVKVFGSTLIDVSPSVS